MRRRVAAFTDTYLPTVNGVTYTIASWRDRWHRDGDVMDVVYPRCPDREPGTAEHPVRSVPFPFYDGYRLGVPRIPKTLEGAANEIDVVHAHTPFTVGLAARRFARRTETPVIATYHTPSGEYAPYLTPAGAIERPVRRLTESYERWFYDRVDLILTPSVATRQYVLDRLELSTPVRVLANGVDVETFRPVDAADFRDRYDLPSGPLVGYTGRHGYEKRLSELLAAADGLTHEDDPVTLVLGGDGPARDALERRARSIDADVRFLGFLDREELPALYSSLDVFGFPSPVETQGLVALEATACGTPVVGVDRGALSETVVDGVTGYHYRDGDVEDFRRKLVSALANRDRLAAGCLEYREEIDLETALERLTEIYDRLVAGEIDRGGSTR